MHLLRWISMIGVLAVMVPATLAGQDSQTANQAEARKVIQDGYIEWGKARVAIDKNTHSKRCAPQFIDRISSYPPRVTVTRYDASVPTVEPNGDAAWR